MRTVSQKRSLKRANANTTDKLLVAVLLLALATLLHVSVLLFTDGVKQEAEADTTQLESTKSEAEDFGTAVQQ
jgi:hypothetical protein